jgi:hypothetical protein
MTTDLDLTIDLCGQAKGTVLHSRLPELPAGVYGFHFEFDAARYPLEQHLCFMRQRDLSLSGLRKFVDMDFCAKPPGIPVGPWPGWRGIPEMPIVELVIGGRTTHARANFWGDEFDSRRCRYFVAVQVREETEFCLKWSDDRLQPVNVRIYPSEEKTVTPCPVQLRHDLATCHPRLLFTEQFRDSIQSDERRAKIWQEIETLLGHSHHPFQIDSESKTLPGPERLHDMDRVILSAFVAWHTGETSRVHFAMAMLRDFLSVVSKAEYEPMLIDTQSGEVLYTVCLAYDWLYSHMSEAERVEFKKELFDVADRVWRHLGFDRQDYAQAHFLGCSHGLLAFSFIFWNEHPQAQSWAAYLHAAFIKVVNMMPADGFYPHGINLWIYEHTFLVRYLELFRHCAGIDFWSTTPYWRNASRFRRLSLSPDRLHGITFGDPQYRVSGDAWIHYAIAARTGSNQAQNLAGLLADMPVDHVDFRSVPPRRRIWEYIFINSQIAEDSELPPLVEIQDGGQVFYRSHSEQKETLFTCRAGAPLGRHRYAAGEWSGYGHSDPCNGSFLLALNSAFLICGPGPVYRRDTTLHNTLTMDGRGQIGDGLPWAPEFTPLARMARMMPVLARDKVISIEMDLASAYLQHLDVENYTRKFYLLEPLVLVIHDHVQLAKPHELQWNLHTRAAIEILSPKPLLRLKFSLEQECMRLLCLSPENISMRTGFSDFVPAYPNGGERDRFVQLYGTGLQKDYIILLALDGTDVQWHMLEDDHSEISHLALTVNGEKHDLW